MFLLILGAICLSIKVDNNSINKTLLPSGLRDQLPPHAAHEASVIEGIIKTCELSGYERVKPPLIEYEDTLFSGPGKEMINSTFRLMDPVSQKMLGLRSDLTIQVARIASSRLGHTHHPLRLCYTGEVLRVMPDDLNPERELVQVGAELIGEDNPRADMEIIYLAYDALSNAGVKSITIDITTPALIPKLVEEMGIGSERGPKLRAALDKKDPSAIAELAGENSELFIGLLEAAGSWSSSIEKMKTLSLPKIVSPILERLEAVAPIIAGENGNVQVTIDPVESRGFEYYSGLGFSFFSRGIRGELGRGGRYILNGDSTVGSCGFTLYMETVLRALPNPIVKKRLLVPHSVNREVLISLRKDGWITVSLLKKVDSLRNEAKRLNCSHIFLEGKTEKI
tara:strand:- start:894 stop:2081 length:1188 start_codon:yes stop_codon:yes gene_type:complete